MAPASDAYVVAVRELCEFAAKSGDLDTRFTPVPTAEEGIAGHKLVASRRAAAHRSEIKLEYRWRGLLIRGRADGHDASRNLLEEVKTFRGRLEGMADNKRALHWAQAKVYGAMLCIRDSLPGLNIALVYFDVDSQLETPVREYVEAGELMAFLETLCARFLTWAQAELRHREVRNAALLRLPFPHASFRAGQRELAARAFTAAKLGVPLLAQASTGIGKTLATLFSQLKAMPGQRLDKVVFLTAKTAGQGAPLAALRQLGSGTGTLPVRVVQLVARDQACVHPDKACHGASCELARGFYDRLGDARSAVVVAGDFSVSAIRDIASRHRVCPYYLSQEMLRWADVVVCDYNYLFDSSAMLHSLALVNDWRLAVLVDEAHNLVDRAREMYSIRLSRGELQAAAANAPAAVDKALRRLERTWARFVNAQDRDFIASSEVPPALVRAMQRVIDEVDAQAADGPQQLDAGLLNVMFGLGSFVRLAESFDSHSFLAVERTGRGRSSIGIRNVVPAPFLKRRLQAMHAAVLFSATLTPARYYTDLLGLPETTRTLDVASPFDPGQLDVQVVRGVSTRYHAREASLAPIASVIGRQWLLVPGNYMAFFSSFDYLEAAMAAFQSAWPSIPVWRQERRMSPADKEAFLARFAEDGSGVGFAVLGGSFGEAVDLPGRRLVGAFVATLGLPQFNRVNEEMRACMERLFGQGYEYAYLYPGIRKVVQAAGRVIRSATDAGVLYLIDDRFGRAEVKRLLPSWWQVRHACAPRPCAATGAVVPVGTP